MQKEGGGASPPTFRKSLWGPRAGQTPKMADARSLKIIKFYTWLAFGRYFILKISGHPGVANRSPTPASKINDFLRMFADIWRVRGRLSRPIWRIPGGPGRNRCRRVLQGGGKGKTKDSDKGPKTDKRNKGKGAYGKGKKDGGKDGKKSHHSDDGDEGSWGKWQDPGRRPAVER